MQLFGLTRGYRVDPARRCALGLLARNGAAILAVPRLNLLARPVAATKVEGSAGRVRSAFSAGQLLNQDGEHAFDLDSLPRELFVVVGLKEFQISGQQELIFQFSG